MSGIPFAYGASSPGTLRALWLLDVVAWALIVACGVVVVTGHSTSVQYVLSGTPVLVGAFATFWIVGGVAGLVTRFLRLGIAEVPAISATLTALLTYEVLIAYAIQRGYPAGLMPWVVGVVILALVTRWVVLHDLGRRRPRRRTHARRG